MLSDTSRPVIEATLPVVGAHIQDIARRFYEHMFAAQPELLDGVFNRGNQAQGRQQQALAGAVAEFADFLIHTPDQLPDHLLRRISHKHASLGLRPEQYDVVHEHLMWAIVDVLGDAVTPEVAAAWDEVYWLMANALINQERTLYAAAGITPDTVWAPWRVIDRIQETPDVVTFVVERIEARQPNQHGAPSLPGQYVTLQALLPDGTHQPRQYSLTRADDGDHRQFSVKRVHHSDTPDGEVSNLLHDTTKVRDELVLSEPFGDVVLTDSEQPVVLISAGIGITPMAGMLSHLAQTGSTRQVTVLHAARNPDLFALQKQIYADLELLPRGSLTIWYTEHDPERAKTTAERTGPMDVTGIDLPAGAQRACRARPSWRS
jgi:nitric oxide dioxygenase